jgi:hypothetical protein
MTVHKSMFIASDLGRGMAGPEELLRSLHIAWKPPETKRDPEQHLHPSRVPPSVQFVYGAGSPFQIAVITNTRIAQIGPT